MGNRYSVALNKTATATTSVPITTLLTASGSRAVVREVGIFMANAVACTVGLGKPAANGSGAATGTLGQAEDWADVASLTTLVTTFATTQPTAPTNFFRRATLPAVIGAGIIWSWEPGEFIVPVSSNFCLWQVSSVTSAGQYETYVKWSE